LRRHIATLSTFTINSIDALVHRANLESSIQERIIQHARRTRASRNHHGTLVSTDDLQ
jgi:hypothetical protein